MEDQRLRRQMDNEKEINLKKNKYAVIYQYSEFL